MKINISVRLKNPAFWLGFLPTVTALVYSVLGAAGITPKIAESELLSAAAAVVSALAALGVLVDPTTEGLGDSERALGYTAPGKRAAV